MKIILTGGSSFTGYWFAQSLFRAGAEVIAPLRRSEASYSGIRKERVRRLAEFAEIVPDAAFGQERFIALCSEGADVLCHHASEVTNYKSADFDVAGALLSNTFNCRKVLTALSSAGCRNIVVTGSVFEQNEGVGEPPLKAFSPYGLSKTLSADVISYFAQDQGLNFRKFVIANPFGPYEEQRFCHYLVSSFLRGDSAIVRTPDYIRDNMPVTLLASCYAKFVLGATSGESAPRFGPIGYAESQGAFAKRFAQEIGSRLGLKADVLCSEHKEFTEPRIRLNSDPIKLQDYDWSEVCFWDDLANYYKAINLKT